MNTDIPYTVVTKEAPEPQYQLTVITVCWNALADLKPTVESVLAQKAKGSISIEHVVVDGASTDGTPEWLAEQLAAGNIERYVSEPDRGIFDAMNKGINLARGRVLAFLNAADRYRDGEDLAPCVLPICRGETESVGAWAYRPNHPAFPEYKTSFPLMYLHCPCCHQAWFASARAYRELGGYDVHGLVCSSDTDIILRICHMAGGPMQHDAFVVDFPLGGFSSYWSENWRHENMEIHWRNREDILSRCAEDRDFRLVMEAFFVDNCYQFRDWQERHGKRVPEQLRKLREMCRLLAPQAHNHRARLALRYLSACYLPPLIRGRKCSRLNRFLCRMCTHTCFITGGNKYSQWAWTPNIPFSSTRFGKRLRRILGKLRLAG